VIDCLLVGVYHYVHLYIIQLCILSNIILQLSMSCVMCEFSSFLCLQTLWLFNFFIFVSAVCTWLPIKI